MTRTRTAFSSISFPGMSGAISVRGSGCGGFGTCGSDLARLRPASCRGGSELDPIPDPRGCPGLVHNVRSNGDHGLLGAVNVGWVGNPHATVQINEHDQRGPCGALVSVREGMVPRQSADEDGCLVFDVGVELDVTEAGLGCCKADSARSERDDLARMSASTPVTCSDSQKYSASVMERVTCQDVPTALGRVRGAAWRGW